MSLYYILILFPLLCRSFQYHDFTSVLTATLQFYDDFKCRCIAVLQTSAKGSAQFRELEKLSHALAVKSGKSWSTQVALNTFEIYSTKLENQEKLSAGTCFKVLNVVVLGPNTKGELEQLSLTFKFTKSRWLLFMNETEDPNFFNDIKLQFNAGIFIVSPVVNQEMNLYEVYRIGESHSVRISKIGNWNSKFVYRGTKHPRYQRRNDLKGLGLRVGAVDTWPVSRFTKEMGASDTEMEGFIADFWDQLQRKMNFTTTAVLRPSDDSAGVFRDDGNWTGLLGMIQRNEIDVVLTTLDYSPKRLEVVQYLLPILQTRFQVFFQPRGYLLDWLAVFRPFDGDVWLAIFGWVIIVSTIMIIFFRMCKNFGLQEHERYDSAYIFFFVLQSISLQGCPQVPKVWACRLVFVLCYLAAAVLIPSYSAALISSLTKKTPVRPFNSLDEMLEHKNCYLLIYGGSSVEYFVGSELDTEANAKYKKAYQKLIIPGMRLAAEDLKQADDYLEYVCKHKNFAYFGSEKWVEFTMHWVEKCTLVKFVQPFGVIHQSIALAKESPLTDVFNYNILRMQESGLIRRGVGQYYPLWKKTIPDDVAAVTFHDIMEPFIFIFASFGISLAILVGEYLHSNWKNKQKNQNYLQARF